MDDELRKTVKIKRARKVATEAGDRNVWSKPIEEVELELVSTGQLKNILESGKQEHKDRIRELAGGQDGVLARSAETHEFEILAEDSFTLEPADKTGDEGELSLVTTQALRRILKSEDARDDQAASSGRDEGGGYNPYDSD